MFKEKRGERGMKKAKSLQRFWAFLLVFVLAATTLGNDSMTVTAAEVESAAEISSEPASDANEDKTEEVTSAASSDSSENEESSEVPEGTQTSETDESEETTEAGGENTETESEITAVSTEDELETEETVTEDVTETSENEKKDTFMVSFDVSGEAVIKVNGEAVASAEAEKDSDLSFQVETGKGYRLKSVTADGADLESSDGSYILKNIQGDTTVSVETEQAAQRLLMRNILRANPEESVTVRISGADDNDGSFLLPVGEIKENAPSFAGYNFVEAKVDQDTIQYVGVYEDIVYYSVGESDAGTILENGREIVLFYESDSSNLNVTYITKVNDTPGSDGGSVTGPEKIKKDSDLTFRVEFNRGYVIDNVKVNGTIINGTKVTDYKWDYTVQKAAQDQEVTVTFKKVNSYKLTYSNNEIRQGNITSPNSGSSFGNGETLKLTLVSDSGHQDGEGTWTDWLLNQLQINGTFVNVPTSYTKGAQATTTLPSGTQVKIELTNVVSEKINTGSRTVDFNKYTYAITITNAYEDIVINSGNFKSNKRPEIIIKQLVGIANNQLYGYEGYTGKWVTGTINTVYKADKDGNEFYFNILPGYDGNKIKLTGTGMNGISIEKGTYYRDGVTYNYRFKVGYSSETNKQIFLSIEKAGYSVKYDLNGGTGNITDSDTYTAFSGENNVVAITNRVPEKEGKVFDHWELAGTSKEYRQYDRFTISTGTIKYANAQNEFVFKAVWADAEDSNYANLQVKYYFEQENGSYKLDETVSYTVSALAEKNAIKLCTDKDAYPGYVYNSQKSKVIAFASNDKKKAEEIKYYFDLKTFNYTVSYYAENTLVGSEQKTAKVSVSNVALSDIQKPTDAEIAKKLTGYKYSKVDPEAVNGKVAVSDGAVIKVYYVEDDDAWVTVTFLPGSHGRLEGILSQKVLKGTLWSEIEVPVIKPDAGYAADGWNPELPESTDKINSNQSYVAQYAEDEDAWATVTFLPGEHGSLDGQTSWKVLKGTEWSEITVPTVTADTDYRHTGWSQALPDAEYQVAEDMTFTALYESTTTPVDPAPTPTPDPGPGPGPGPDAPAPGAAPAATAGVLGEAFAPEGPEMGVLGEAFAPEVSVLGESKGPGTGDTAPIAGWSLLMMGAVLTLGFTVYNKKRKKEEE